MWLVGCILLEILEKEDTHTLYYKWGSPSPLLYHLPKLICSKTRFSHRSLNRPTNKLFIFYFYLCPRKRKVILLVLQKMKVGRIADDEPPGTRVNWTSRLINNLEAHRLKLNHPERFMNKSLEPRLGGRNRFWIFQPRVY